MFRIEVQRLLLRSTALLVAVSSFLGLVQAVQLRGVDISTLIAALAVGVPLLALWLGERGNVRGGGLLLVASMFILVSAITGYYGNRYPGTSTLYLLCAMLAGFLLGPRAAVAVSAGAVVVCIALAVVEMTVGLSQ